MTTGASGQAAANIASRDRKHDLGKATDRARRQTGVWFRFRRHRLAIVGGSLILLLVVSAISASFIGSLDPYTVNLDAYRTPPSLNHWLGTDSAGRDVLSRILHAGRVSMSVGLVAVSIYTVIGIVLGSLAGFYGGYIDTIIMRASDMVLAFPSLIIIITIVSILGPSLYNVMLVIGGLGWPAIARLVRGNFLVLRRTEFVIGAEAIGANDRQILFKHMLPNALAPVIVAASFGMAEAILLEAGLSFLGLGVQPPTPSWGNMLTDAQSVTVLRSMPWLWLSPGMMIALAVISINLVGDGLRDALDPQQRR